MLSEEISLTCVCSVGEKRPAARVPGHLELAVITSLALPHAQASQSPGPYPGRDCLPGMLQLERAPGREGHANETRRSQDRLLLESLLRPRAFRPSCRSAEKAAVAAASGKVTSFPSPRPAGAAHQGGLRVHLPVCPSSPYPSAGRWRSCHRPPQRPLLQVDVREGQQGVMTFSGSLGATPPPPLPLLTLQLLVVSWP